MSEERLDRIESDLRKMKRELAELKAALDAGAPYEGGGASFAVIEPFLMDIICLLDRVRDAGDDAFALSVGEELFDIVRRRGVERIRVGARFDSDFHEIVYEEEDESATRVRVARVFRDGYVFEGRVLRRAEVGVVRPPR
ncbi:nucleotide exchange factor GrpE [Curtanaerobium respiraculi]|uniref:nucleotide exchange factor GrpE n=1 Tax=Curtanaerobium respiraculi TaxID=2949669 RepID=UPI0024B38E92|nr:nucleotide exchange factor GrpE [Curtanaerobium respiraculi]